MNPCTGVILCADENTGFEGREKAFISVGGKRIMDRIYSVFSALFEEIILVTHRPQYYLDWDLTIVTDLLQTRCSLSGIHSGLFYASYPHTFVTACNTPFLKTALVEKILSYADDRMDACIPETESGFEPLCAVYAKKALPTVENYLSRGRFNVIGAFRNDRIKKIPEKVLRRHDPELISFYKLNEPEEMGRTEALAQRVATQTATKLNGG